MAIEIAENAQLWFTEQLEEVLAHDHLKISECARAHVVFLLARLVRGDFGLQEPLAVEYLAGLNAVSERERISKFRSVGDRALLASGYFHRMTGRDRRRLDCRYPIRIGQKAYLQIEVELFAELAEKFVGIACTPAHMADRTSQFGDKDVLALYHLYLDTHHPYVARLLADRGVVIGSFSRTPPS